MIASKPNSVKALFPELNLDKANEMNHSFLSSTYLLLLPSRHSCRVWVLPDLRTATTASWSRYPSGSDGESSGDSAQAQARSSSTTITELGTNFNTAEPWPAITKRRSQLLTTLPVLPDPFNRPHILDRAFFSTL